MGYKVKKDTFDREGGRHVGRRVGRGAGQGIIPLSCAIGLHGTHLGSEDFSLANNTN